MTEESAVTEEQPYFPNRPPAEHCYIEHVRIFPDEDSDYELLRAHMDQRLRRGWKLVSVIKDPSGESLRLEWDASEAYSEN